jgi:hypothetical protein
VACTGTSTPTRGAARKSPGPSETRRHHEAGLTELTRQGLEHGLGDLHDGLASEHGRRERDEAHAELIRALVLLHEPPPNERREESVHGGLRQIERARERRDPDGRTRLGERVEHIERPIHRLRARSIPWNDVRVHGTILTARAPASRGDPYGMLSDARR